jgi:hypothetical protein
MTLQHPPDYLQRYSDAHVFYEIAMFFQFGFLLAGQFTGQFRVQPSELTDLLRNGIIEAFVLHLRNLLDFFYTPPRKSDIAASMFYDSGKLPSNFPSKSPLLEQAHRRAHKEMSHLTTDRLWEGDPKKGWNFIQLMMEMRPRVEKFLQTASAARLHPEFVTKTNMLLGNVPKAVKAPKQKEH